MNVGGIIYISQKGISAGAAALFVLSVVVQSLVTVRAERMGYIQSDCPAIVKQAIDTVGSECTKAGRNKLCYGNSTIQAKFQPGANKVTFQAPGDSVDVSQIQQFTLGAMDTTSNTWGVAEMKIKADLPDTDPTQAVTMILFGNVQITDADTDANLAVLTQTPGAIAQQNQYATATTNAVQQQVTHEAATVTKIAGLAGTATAKALTPTPTGTIPAFKASQVAATATKLAVYQNTATAAPIPQTPIPGVVSGPYNNLQAFYFQSKDSAPCDQAPHDGILIQSPQGSKHQVTLSVDGATIALGSTVYMTAQPSHFLTINTLEGSAIITAAGQTQTANAGRAVRVPLDATLHASGAPTAPSLYNADTVRALPVRVLPDTSVTFTPGMPTNLTFTTWNWTLQTATCADPSLSPADMKGQPVPGDVAFNETTMWLQHQPFVIIGDDTVVLSKSPDGTYTALISLTLGDAIFLETDTWSMRIDNPTQISGTLTQLPSDDGDDDEGPCVLTFTLTPSTGQ